MSGKKQKTAFDVLGPPKTWWGRRRSSNLRGELMVTVHYLSSVAQELAHDVGRDGVCTEHSQ